jgi:hypothetical protein
MFSMAVEPKIPADAADENIPVETHEILSD